MDDARYGGRKAVTVWALVACAVIVVALLVLWVLPSVLTRHPSAGLGAAERLKAANDVRGSLAALLLAIGAAAGVWFTARTFRLNREGQVTERYTRAVDQIGADSLEVRIGGIYALERIGRDSTADRRTVVYVLGFLARHRSKDGREPDKEPPEDVYAALRVISRLAPGLDVRVNLEGADLRNARLRFMRDVPVRIDGAEVTGATLPPDWSP
jgi:hypothetical protein